MLKRTLKYRYGDVFARDFLVDHRSKLFNDDLFAASEASMSDVEDTTMSPGEDVEMAEASFLNQRGRPRSRAPTTAPPSPFSHPTPNLLRLAQSVQEAQTQASLAQANVVPSSPTLAKLLGAGASHGGGEAGPGRKRKAMSRSTSNTSMALREVSMGPTLSRSTSAEGGADSQSKLFGSKAVPGKARTSKRKQSSPKSASCLLLHRLASDLVAQEARHANELTEASSGRTLIMATPAKRPAASRTASMPNLSLNGGPANGAASFADLGRSFRPGSFAAIEEEALLETVRKPAAAAHGSGRKQHVLASETPQGKRGAWAGFLQSGGLGETPG